MNVKDTVQIVLASDAKYIMPMTVAICSIAANYQVGRPLTFSIVHDRVPLELQKKAVDSLGRFSREDIEIHWIEAPIERFGDLKVTHSWITPLTFVRLLVPELLPGNVEKAIYLDCDVVVRDDIGKLWDVEIGESSLLAARDLIGVVSASSAGIRNYRELGIPGDAKYFNAGVLVLNLRKWRENNTTGRVLSYLRTYRDIICAADQEALNCVLFNDWRELDFSWNWQIMWRGYRMGTHELGYVPETTEKRIVHFHSDEKPWLPGCDYIEKDLFFEYLDRTEWAGWRVPWYKEIYGRAVRRLWDARNAVGRMRRKLKSGIASATI